MVEWVPVYTRCLDSEEQQAYDSIEILDCPVPENGEEVLVTYSCEGSDPKVGVTVFWSYEGGFFADFNVYDVLAWAHFPKPWGVE